MRMKERVTVTVDREVVNHAKRVAHRTGRSLSGLVEQSLRASMGTAPRRAGSFVERWSGKFSVRDGDIDDPRLRALKTKHGLR